MQIIVIFINSYHLRKELLSENFALLLNLELSNNKLTMKVSVTETFMASINGRRRLSFAFKPCHSKTFVEDLDVSPTIMRSKFRRFEKSRSLRVFTATAIRNRILQTP